jgi:hypothetical protein
MIIETDDFWLTDDAFVFKPRFNEKIDKYLELISKRSKLIFANRDCLHETLILDNRVSATSFNPDKNFVGSHFNTKFKLPENVTCLMLGSSFNKEVELHDKLVYLRFGILYVKRIELPQSLTHLYFESKSGEQLKLPPNLIHLCISRHYDIIPKKITCLEFDEGNIDDIKIPESVTNLKFGVYYCDDVKLSQKLPNVTHMTICSTMSEDFILPEKLYYLKFEQFSNKRQELSNYLRELEINHDNNLINYLSSSIINIKLGPDFKMKLENITNNIINLRFDHRSEPNVGHNKKIKIPVKTKYLKLSYIYDKKIKNNYKNLKIIKCSPFYKYIDVCPEYIYERIDTEYINDLTFHKQLWDVIKNKENFCQLILDYVDIINLGSTFTKKYKISMPFM